MKVLDMAPLPCPRPRIAVRGRFPVAYYPDSYKKWKVAAAEKLRELRGQFFEDGPVRLTLVFYVSKPKTTKLSFPKPDIDNYLKSFMDAATTAEHWSDDAQVTTCVVKKRFTAHAEEPGYVSFLLEQDEL